MPRKHPKPKPRFAGLLDYLDHRLGAHGGDGPEYQYWCPFCIDRLGSESDGRKLWLNVAKQVAHCFRCAYGTRDLLRFFRDLNGGALRYEELALLRGEVTPPEADVASAVLDILVRHSAADTPPRPVPVPPEMRRLAPHAGAVKKPVALRRAFRYLRERGITATQIVQFDLGFCVEGRYAQRLIFPVFQNGARVYFTSRYCGAHRLKALNPPKEDGAHTRQTCLLNYDRVVGAPQIGLVEGAFDTMAFPHGVGLLGKVISPVQVRLLAALVPHGLREVLVCLDADAAVAAEAVYDRLVRRVPSVRILPLDWGDPHDRRADLPALRAQATTPSTRQRVQNRLRRKETS